MQPFFRVVLAAFMVTICFTGCTTTKGLYYWGGYETSIYDMYLEPGKDSSTDAILQLETQVEKAAAAGQSVPPGLHAHLGYLYALEGDETTALVHFQTEKEKFPESALFIDGLIERMKK